MTAQDNPAATAWPDAGTTPAQPDAGTATPWPDARTAAHAAGAAARPAPTEVPLAQADGATLATGLRALGDLPAFRTSSVDGWAVRGPAPWRITGRILAGTVAPALGQDGTCVEIATGAMVPADADALVRVEYSQVTGDRASGGLVSGEPRAGREWRETGEECAQGEQLLAAGTPVTPGVIGLAAACGYDTLLVAPVPTVRVIVFGDELLTSGPARDGRVRDSLGPALPGWLIRLGARPLGVTGPIPDTLDAHEAALRSALAAGTDLICTTGGTMHGPVDHLHPALARLGGRYLVNTVEVRPGFPMLLATLPRPDGGTTLLCGLPGNPQSAIVALLSLVAPALAGLRGRPVPEPERIRLAEPIGGRGGYTHLALVSRGPDGRGYPVRHVGSAMLRGLAGSAGFAVLPPGTDGRPGDEVDLVALPLVPGEHR